MKEALYFKKLENKRVDCYLCPHNCQIEHGKTGICGVRINRDGELYSVNYGKISSAAFDPIEKKPLYHFYPGSLIFSIGSVGCNMKCSFCQNCEISQVAVENFPYLQEYTPTEIANLANERNDNIGIAYTYNEPTIYYEMMLDTAMIVAKRGMKNVMVSNGFINKEPLHELMHYMDAFNIDLKAFTDKFYRDFTKSKLEPVKQTLVEIEKAGKHLEITNLVIPGLNSDEEVFAEMVRWIAENVDKGTVLHLSRYFPRYRLNVESTPGELIKKFYNIAKEYLDYVYIGNMHADNDTYCSHCGKKVIDRSFYSANPIGLENNGKCSHCQNQIAVMGS